MFLEKFTDDSNLGGAAAWEGSCAPRCAGRGRPLEAFRSVIVGMLRSLNWWVAQQSRRAHNV